ncbi:A24 family peptidase [Paenibacillus sp. YYML68]|uniref:prepilin peptidase n=1 Tax=Paenibacillus sp. YYML68 TaxID=2909250 RepID=UPI002490B49A|nr:A24 family peptidase [Paenibacillus sp. YYML68]
MSLLHETVKLYAYVFHTYPYALPVVCGLFGLLIGSFLNVLALRLPTGDSFIYPPSHCVYCKHRLGALDLVPVLSYVVLGGKCRYCRTPISWIYPFGELMTAVLFALMAWQLGPTPELLVGLFLAAVLSAITVTDLKYMLIPDKIIAFALLLGLILRAFIHTQPFWYYVVSAFAGGALLYAIAWASERWLRKEGMGGGDIKLFVFIGLMLGFKLTLLTLFAASLFGLIGGLVLLRLSKQNQEAHIPFGPFIALGAVFSYLWGEASIALYIQFILN